MKFAQDVATKEWFEEGPKGWTSLKDGRVAALPADQKRTVFFPDEAAAAKAGFVKKATPQPQPQPLTIKK